MDYQEKNKTIPNEVEVPLKINYKSLSTSEAIDDDVSAIITLNVDNMNNNFESSTSLDNISLCNAKCKSTAKELSDDKNICKRSNEDLRRDNDSLEIQSTLSNFQMTWYQKPKSINVEVLKSNNDFSTLKRIRSNPFTVRKTAYGQDHVNIIECLLDLDNYLDKMDPDLNLNSSSVVSLSSQNISEINSPLERNSKLRYTVDCSFRKQKNMPKMDAVPTYGTWNKRTLIFNSYQQQENKTSAISNSLITNVNINRDIPQCSTVESFRINDAPRNYTENEISNNNNLAVLTNDQIIQNFIEQHNYAESDRPRQLGRRAEREHNSIHNIIDINCDNNLTHTNVPDSTCIPEIFCQNAGSDESMARTSCNTTPATFETNTDTSESLVINNSIDDQNITVVDEANRMSSRALSSEFEESCFNTHWPHNFSRTLALISCTLGLFNINRFAIFTINYGGNFLIQFLILSIIFGIPFLWLQMSLGAKIKAGPISMWKVSPICIGIGISIFFVQYFIAIYSSIAIVWLFIYIQDIFFNKSYPWVNSIYPIINRKYSHNCSSLTENIPDYFNVKVLQRVELLMNNENREHTYMNDNLLIGLVFLWFVVFLILCKGIKSLGKIIFLIGTLPIILLAMVAVKLLCVVDLVKLQNVFSSSEYEDFFVNSKTWAAAAQETFLTWGLCGASIISVSSRKSRNCSELALRKDAIIVVVVTLIVLSLSALAGLCSIQILNESGFIYVPGSYEFPEQYSAIFSLKSLLRSDFISFPTKLVPHYSTLVGEVYRRHTDATNVSGYQVLRFVTEVIPATMATSIEQVSWFWTAIVYIAFFLFGVSQLCVMWKPISLGLGNSSQVVLISCISGVLLSIPFATVFGIRLLHYMDILLGGSWFIPALWSAQILGIFLIRGRPYNGDDLVNDLKMCGSMSAFLALTWNILLPIGLVTLAIVEYKISLSNQLFYRRGKSYFSYWSKKAGCFTQIGLLILIPISAIIQICRYLSSGPPDILDRIQMLYRPLEESSTTRRHNRISRNLTSTRYENSSDYTAQGFQNDAPPKYTPPPSYTTATGARLAKSLRRSFRRSIRRILGESERTRSVVLTHHETQIEQDPFPASMPTAEEIGNSIGECIEFDYRPINLRYGRCLSLDRKQIINKFYLKKDSNGLQGADVGRSHCDTNSNGMAVSNCNNRQYMAEDVIAVLRSSTLGRRRNSMTERLQSEPTFRSVENLIQNSVPPNLSSPMIDNL